MYGCSLSVRAGRDYGRAGPRRGEARARPGAGAAGRTFEKFCAVGESVAEELAKLSSERRGTMDRAWHELHRRIAPEQNMSATYAALLLYGASTVVPPPRRTRGSDTRWFVYVKKLQAAGYTRAAYARHRAKILIYMCDLHAHCVIGGLYPRAGLSWTVGAFRYKNHCTVLKKKIAKNIYVCQSRQLFAFELRFRN